QYAAGRGKRGTELAEERIRPKPRRDDHHDTNHVAAHFDRADWQATLEWHRDWRWHRARVVLVVATTNLRRTLRIGEAMVLQPESRGADHPLRRWRGRVVLEHRPVAQDDEDAIGTIAVLVVQRALQVEMVGGFARVG